MTITAVSKFARSTNISDKLNAFWTWLNNNKYVMCAILIVLGLFTTFLGCKLCHVIIFITGILLTVSLVLIIFYSTFLKADTKAWVGWVVLGCSVLVGILVGWILFKIIKLGAFVLGAWGGFSLGLIIYEALPLYKIDSQIFFWCFCVGIAICCGVLAIILLDHALIIATAILGAYLCISGIGLVAGHYQNPFTIVIERINGLFVYIDPWFYAYLAGMLVLAALGVYVQYRHRSSNGG